MFSHSPVLLRANHYSLLRLKAISTSEENTSKCEHGISNKQSLEPYCWGIGKGPTGGLILPVVPPSCRVRRVVQGQLHPKGSRVCFSGSRNHRNFLTTSRHWLNVSQHLLPYSSPFLYYQATNSQVKIHRTAGTTCKTYTPGLPVLSCLTIYLFLSDSK